MAVRNDSSPNRIIRSRHDSLIVRTNPSAWASRFGERGDTYGHLFPGRGKEASARYEKSTADAKVRHKAEASVSNPLAIDREEGPEGTVTN